jgi:hypothetical protein
MFSSDLSTVICSIILEAYSHDSRHVLSIPWNEERKYHYYLDLNVGFLTFLETLFY